MIFSNMQKFYHFLKISANQIGTQEDALHTQIKLFKTKSVVKTLLYQTPQNLSMHFMSEFSQQCISTTTVTTKTTATTSATQHKSNTNDSTETKQRHYNNNTTTTTKQPFLFPIKRLSRITYHPFKKIADDIIAVIVSIFFFKPFFVLIKLFSILYFGQIEFFQRQNKCCERKKNVFDDEWI